MTMVYRFGDSRGGFGVPAQVAGERLAALRDEKGDGFTPRDVVDDARPDDAPLHPVFEWNDAVAADEFRLTQARFLIRSVVLVREDTNPERPQLVRAFVSTSGVSDEEMAAEGDAAAPLPPQRMYAPVGAVMQHRERRERLLREALRDLNSWRRRYRTLQELAEVCAAIDRVQLSLTLDRSA